MDELMIPLGKDIASERAQAMCGLANTAHLLDVESEEYMYVLDFMKLLVDATHAGEEPQATVTDFPKGVN